MDRLPLNRLSPELRNIIYGLVLVKRPISISSLREAGHHEHALAKTCRQLRQETLLLDYASIELLWDGRLVEDSNDDHGVPAWLRKIGPQAAGELTGISSIFRNERRLDELKKIWAGQSIEVFDGIEDDFGKNLNWWYQEIFKTLQDLGVHMRKVAVFTHPKYTRNYVLFSPPRGKR